MNAGFRIFVFTCREPESDFRQPLVDALRRYYDVYCIRMRRRPVISGPDQDSPTSEMSLAALVKMLARRGRDGRIDLHFDSTDACLPGVMLFLRSVARRGVWCLDMHDDLRYYHRGLARLRRTLAISLLRMSSHAVVCAGAALTELFPGSHVLGNASHILPVPHEGADPGDVLILTSFDARFDFDFVARLARASATARFHIHGWTRNSDPETARRVSTFVAEHANIVDHGPYATDDLPLILRTYRVMVAPYRNSLLTRTIDPLRFYHCLNAGLEVISTDIPSVRALEPWVHIVRDAEHCAETLRRIQAGEVSRPNGFVPITWEGRVSRLMEIVNGLERTRELCGRASERRRVTS
jgi:hypothetical protein